MLVRVAAAAAECHPLGVDDPAIHDAVGPVREDAGRALAALTQLCQLIVRICGNSRDPESQLRIKW